MIAKLKDKIFWVFSVIFTIVIFVIALNSNQTYQSETDILFLPKSEVAARNIDQIVANAEQIPMSLSFYDKLIEKNSDIEDGASELPNDKRKQFWNSEIKIERVGKSGIVRIVAFNPNQMQAEIINRQITSDLIAVMSKYYNIKTDLDMRIIDGPILSQSAKINVILWIFLSLLFGSILGFIGSIIVGSIVKIVEKDRLVEHQDLRQKPSIFPKFSVPMPSIQNLENKFINKKSFNFNIEEEHAFVQPKKENVAAFIEKKAIAPSNLPIAEDETMFAAQTGLSSSLHPRETGLKADNDGIIPDVFEKNEAAQDTTREATPEEVRMRLNKLLGGGTLK